MDVQQHFQGGRLSEAIAAATDSVKKAPTDLDRRALLCELLCFAGDLDRADHHLDTVSKQDTSVATGASLLRQLIRAETHRRQFFEEGRVPLFTSEPSDEMQMRLRASIELRENRPEVAAELLAQANEAAGVACTVNDRACEGFRDLDDLTATVFEVLTPNGKYYWVPMAEVQSIEFRKPDRPLDLLWRPALMSVREGPEGEVYLPALYSGSHQAEDEATKLGRTTDWRDESGIARGIGQRMYLCGEEAVTLMELSTISLETEAQPQQ